MARGDASGLYVPEEFSGTPTLENLYAYLQREIRRISAAVSFGAARHLDEQSVAPAKPRDGDVAFADGTLWNPGSGRGPYMFWAGTWHSMAGGNSLTITQVEVNLGTAWVTRGNFVVIDAAISPTSKIIIAQAPGPYTGKGTRADEAEMDQITCQAAAGTGQFVVRWQTVPMESGNSPLQPIQHFGRVHGNVKFLYTFS